MAGTNAIEGRAAGEIDDQLAGANAGRRRLRRSWNPSKRRTDASQQLGRAERLVDEVVGARVQGLHFVGFGIAHGEHDDSDAGAGADLAAGSQSAHARHVHIEQDQVGMIIAQLLDRLFAGLGVVHFISGAGESGPHDAADLGLVVNHQDASGAHGRAPVPPAAAPVFAAHELARVAESLEKWFLQGGCLR